MLPLRLATVARSEGSPSTSTQNKLGLQSNIIPSIEQPSTFKTVATEADIFDSEDSLREPNYSPSDESDVLSDNLTVAEIRKRRKNARQTMNALMQPEVDCTRTGNVRRSCEQCKRKCHLHFSENRRELINQAYWSMTWQERQIFLTSKFPQWM
ncbi:unnamed protein product [Brassicogethes aeneus]|uniref:Uncharacterized protein n=1 Tax=Brassicogethes aeneus TaxID=1431903 RepID=A0A9P0AVW1_BRAAE|nr:unnamed protein product [Brassicogethes aeneus]